MVSYLQTFFELTYELFASIRVPGFGISILVVLLGSVGAVVSISLLKMFFGIGNSAVSGGSRYFFQKGGNSRNIKIDEKRRGDEK